MDPQIFSLICSLADHQACCLVVGLSMASLCHCISVSLCHCVTVFLCHCVTVFLLQGIMDPQICSLLFLVVGLSMAVTPWLGAFGQILASKFDQQDMKSLQPTETEVLSLYTVTVLRPTYSTSVHDVTVLGCATWDGCVSMRHIRLLHHVAM